MSDMSVFEDSSAMRLFSRSKRSQGLRIGFVPTMGFLHEGHLSLVRAAREQCDVVVASIYVNPTQFSKNEDFGVYPKSIEADMEKLKSVGCHALFLPATLYYKPENITADDTMVVGSHESENRDGHSTWVQVDGVSEGLCASSRPHFFRGVTTIVTKLFNIVEPDAAFFGKKDYQQFKVITRMVRDLNFDIEIIGGEIEREKDGLAMSSRNALLTKADRAAAPILYKLLATVKELCQSDCMTASEIKEMISSAIKENGGKVDYVDLVDSESLVPITQSCIGHSLIAVAAFFGTVRLIDNIEI